MDDARNNPDGQVGDNRISLDGSHFANVGSINVNVHGKQQIDSRVQEYEVDHVDHGNAPWLAKTVDTLLKDKAPAVLYGFVASAMGSGGLIVWTPQFIQPFIQGLIWTLVISLFFAMAIGAGLHYQKNYLPQMQCKIQFP